jgi:polar amino acid transport system permease protein
MSGVAPTTPPELLDDDRSPRVLGRLRPGGLAIALISSVVFFGIAGYVIVNARGWPLIQEQFFNWDVFWRSMPVLIRGLLVNIQLFLLAEVFILIFALLLAVMRSLPGPAFFPLRLTSVVYIDLFRAIPSILIIYMLGFGGPALGLPGLPDDAFSWGVIALVIVWSAYVAEVYRAGIEGVHPSQEAAARSLGLSRFQGLRYVVLPQAVRRVVPPLMNDFIGLQKDTALVASIGLIEVFRRAQILESGSFNFTPFVATAVLFLLLTIPLARLVDWIAARDRRRQQASLAR